MQLRNINQKDPVINGISRPVEIDTLPGELTLSEIQISLNIIQLPGTNNYVLAQDFAALLACLLSGTDVISTTDQALQNWLLNNICKPSHDQRKIRLRPEKQAMTANIVEQILHPKEN